MKDDNHAAEDVAHDLHESIKETMTLLLDHFFLVAAMARAIASGKDAASIR